MKILMVCLGNICRSPLAEGIMKSKLDDSFFVDSAGTIGFHEGEGPDKRSVKIAANYGVDISSQKSRPISKLDLDRFDLIFCMDKSNLKDVLRLSNDNQKRKVKLILDNDQEVPDPYYGDLSDFDAVFKLLDEACEKQAENIKNRSI